MELSAERYADVVVVSVHGRIDHHSAGEFETALAPHLEQCSADEAAVVLALGGVDYMSSVGLRVLMLASRQVRRRSGRLVVCGLGETLAEIFAIARFDQVFDIYPDTDAALAALSPAAAQARGAGG